MAQSGIIKGMVMDSISREPIEYASIRLLTPIDSSYVKGISANEKGQFRLPISPGKYILQISYLGYKTYQRPISTTPLSPNINIGILYLINDDNLLDEAVVVAKVPDIVVKGDTIEYNADSYISQENELLQDIVKRIPGIEIDSEGRLTANGKPINKILVDGKEFFDNDIQLALKNLPASMIKKLQLFKEESESSKITGFKDGKQEQVLNLTVKEEYKQSIFGDARAGYGSDDKYSAGTTVNYMDGDNQLYLGGNMNNVQDEMMLGGMRGGFSSHSGINKEKSLGVNFNRQKSKNFKIGGNIRYSDRNNLFESRNYTENFGSPEKENSDFYDINQNSSENNNKNMNIGTNLEWHPDSLTTVFFRVSGGFSKTQDRRYSEKKSFSEQRNDTTYGWSDYFTKGKGNSLNTSLVVGRKLNDKGRTINMNFNANLRNDDSDGRNYSSTYYSSSDSTRIIDQIMGTENKSNNWGITLSYVEPITSKNSLMFSYSYRQNQMDRVKNAYKQDSEGNYSVIDTAYTRKTETYYSNQNINVQFQSIHEKYEYSIGIGIEPSYSKNKVIIPNTGSHSRDSLVEDTKQNVVNFSPSLRFNYKPNESTSLDFNYSGSTNHPALSQLSGDTIETSATTKMVGNPDLKPSFNNNFSIYFQKSNYETGRFMMIMASVNQTLNQAAGYEIVDTLFNRISTYKNVNGNWSGNLSLFFNTPLKNKKFTFDTNTSLYYSRSVGFRNDIKNITNNYNFNETVTIKFRNEKVESRLQVGYAFNKTKNNGESRNNPNTSRISVNNSTVVNLPYDFSIQNEVYYTYNSGYSSELKKSELLWNASISKQFLKKKMGTLKVQFYDILDDRNNVSRNVDSNSISDMWTNTVNRYFLVSFSYRFNIFRGKSKDQPEPRRMMNTMYY